MSLGIFLSTFARTELQVIQFIPLVIVPQFLLSGVLFPVNSLPEILQPLVNLMPLHYAVEALRLVFIRGADLSVQALQVDIAGPGRDRGPVRGHRLAHDPPGRGVSRASGRRTGRRPGSEDTGGRILAAAREAFGERGFDGCLDARHRRARRRGPRPGPPLLRDASSSCSSRRASSRSTWRRSCRGCSPAAAGTDGRAVRPVRRGAVGPAGGAAAAARHRPLRLHRPGRGRDDARLLAEGPFLALAHAVDRPRRQTRARRSPGSS